MCCTFCRSESQLSSCLEVLDSLRVHEEAVQSIRGRCVQHFPLGSVLLCWVCASSDIYTTLCFMIQKQLVRYFCARQVDAVIKEVTLKEFWNLSADGL